MRIVCNYLKELIDEEAQLDNQTDSVPEEKQPVTEEANAIAARFVEGLIRMRKANLDKKCAEGLCMSLAEFRELSELAHELASRIGLDCVIGRKSHHGYIELTMLHFDLSKDETPELVESMARLFARADRIFIEPVSKYNRPLTELFLHYDLDE